VSVELRILEFLLSKRRALVGEVASLLGYSESLVTEVVERYSDLVKLVRRGNSCCQFN
jgi:DNA-binding MarR family transcriptional regulator